MSALPKRGFTPEEYLALEVKADYRSQYVAGEIYAMAGVQPWHIKVTSNLGGMLYNRLRGGPCQYFSSAMRVRVKAGDLWTYPGLSALCGKPKFETTENPHSLVNPQVIFEVLSPSTESFDRGDKFRRYRKLESLMEYVLLASEEMRVEHFARTDQGTWTLTEYDQPGDLLRLASIGCELPLADIYENVPFPGEDEG